MAARVLFYLSLCVFLFSTLGLGVGGFVFASAMQKQKAQLQDVGMRVPQSTQLALDLADFYLDFWWLIVLLIVFPSLLLTILLGVNLRRRRLARRG